MWNCSIGTCETSPLKSAAGLRYQPCSTAMPEPALRTPNARYTASSVTSAMPPPPGAWNHLSTNPIFCGASVSRDAIRSGRRPASIERSAARAARFADRTEANVAPARTSVPLAVASAEIVTQSAMGRVYESGELVVVEAEVRRRAILQPIGARQRQRCDERTDDDHACDEADTQRGAGNPPPQDAWELQHMREDVDPEGTCPDDEARLVQADECPFRLADDEQRDTGPEDDDRGEHQHRADKQAQHDVGWASPNVLVAAAVVAEHPPPGAADLQCDDRDQQHPDERVDGQKRSDIEQRRALDQEQHDQERCGGRGQLLVAGAPAGECPLHPRHDGSEAGGG